MRALALLVVLTSAACGSSTDAGNSSLSVKGTWTYMAVQSAPALNISGTLNIDQQTGSGFSGTAQFTEIDVQGTVHTRTGPLNGSVAGSDVVDFDIFIDNATRRHVARVVADSMGGTWAYTGGTLSSTGAFAARRIQ